MLLANLILTLPKGNGILQQYGHVPSKDFCFSLPRMKHQVGKGVLNLQRKSRRIIKNRTKGLKDLNSSAADVKSHHSATLKNG